MKTDLFIAGGKDPFGTYRRFYIGDRHTAYEWAMVLADRHPHTAYLNVYGVGMSPRFRRAAIEISPQSAAIYRAIEAALNAGEIESAVAPKQNWYDPPAVSDDPTQRVFDVTAMLTVIRGLGANGRIIGKLLAQDPETGSACRLMIAAETKTRQWLIDLMKEGNSPTESKPGYLEQAKKKMFKVGKRAFNRAWEDAITKTGNNKWSRPGRKSKHRIDTPI